MRAIKFDRLLLTLIEHRRERKRISPKQKLAGWSLLFLLVLGVTGVLKIKKSCRLRGDECSFYNLWDWLLSDPISLTFAALLVGLGVYVIWVTLSVLSHSKED